MTVGLGLIRSPTGQSGTDTVRLTLPGPEYVYVDWIRARNPAGGGLSLVHMTPQLALLPVGVGPVESDWATGAWAATPAPDDGRATAYWLVGTGDDTVVPVTAGTWSMWSRVLGGVETPIRVVGRLETT